MKATATMVPVRSSKIESPVRFNPMLPEYLVNPYPQFRALRETDPLHWSPTLGVWLLTRYADVHAALRDPRFSCMSERWEHYQKFFLRGGSVSSPLGEMYSKWMLQRDPPDHTRLRALVNKAFTSRAVEAMRPRIQRAIDDLLDRVVKSGSIDVMADVAFPLPILVISEMLGVPAEDYPKIRDWTSALLPSISPAASARDMTRINQVIVEYYKFFGKLIKDRLAEPKDDLLTALLQAREEGSKLTEEELLATCVFMIFAGHVTTTQLIGKGMLTLLQHPEQLEMLRQDPSLIGNAVEEMLRYESPFQLLYRTSAEEIQLHGKTILPRQMILLGAAAANHDPEQFTDPDSFDIKRDCSKHLAFAYGIHYCAGAPLARMEGQLAINSMLRRLPELTLHSSGIRREPSILLRGLTTLPLTFKAAA
jgi:pimeloyl-[acyl-carrier protein] synthase